MHTNVEKIVQKHIDHMEWLPDTEKKERKLTSKELEGTRYHKYYELITYKCQKKYNW